jgi:hypothetical protein
MVILQILYRPPHTLFRDVESFVGMLINKNRQLFYQHGEKRSFSLYTKFCALSNGRGNH